MALGIDDFLDDVRDALIASDKVPELTGTVLANLPDPAQQDGNVQVFHYGEADPSDAMAASMLRCKGIHALIIDQGAQSDPEEGDAPILQAEVIIDLFINPKLRNRKANPGLRLPGKIRNSVMVALHRNPALNEVGHTFYAALVRGYKPVADPEYTVWRITLTRTIYLLDS